MIGTVLGNRYEIIEKIGGGGMALVYKAKCRLLNRNVAIKILRDEFINDEEFIKKFRRESQAAASLSHPNIVNIYDVGVDKKNGHDIQYIVMEYIKGKTLKDVIREKGKLTVAETIDYSIQIAEALEHAHKNHIVHRDIKPHNIMVTEDERIKVTDFGIARAATASTVTNTSNVIGSVHYFSPEQARGGYTDEKSDIYSLGIVMYEMITGKVPFKGDSPITVALKHIQEEIVPPRDLDNTVPIGLQNIIMRCVKKSQVDRYSTANELLNDLKRFKFANEDLSLEDTNIIEAPTQIIPAVEDGNENNMKKSKKKKKNSQGDGGLKVVFLAILLAFIVVSSLALGFFKLKDYFISSEVVVPNLVGMYKDEAKEEVEKLGLEFSVVNEVYNNEFEKDQIVNQRTKAGTKVKEGFTIEVTISKGGNLVKVPNLINRNINEVDSLLREANLAEGLVDYDYHDTIEANLVISQSPDPYNEVEEGTKVNVVVSQGPKKKLVIMPKLIGLSEKEAKNALVAYGLVLDNTKKETNDEYAEGLVFWQSIEPGTEIETNTAVDIYVSTGPKEEPEPVETDKEIPFKISLTPISENEEVEVKVKRIQDGNSEVVYNKVHKVDGKSITIPVKGKPDAKFEVYYDDVFIDQIAHPEG
ncbi:putative serine/threonine-protein kinase Sps1 [[Clostridium] ultunense Esp]|uniref:non-specific serine/threonine protein kinase n=1 Tax=[Clostridium] ultunense Esp TaxID=1288971 RepID=M1ZC41_9FIRM|nr:Stk1 family PASTA domain-containing Ser/Thr kinase [Schnuerera ultunensis]CCQ96061.1 putative serine/threonine-protein kinase Sps1 [[Clostridium] ultunense Esp]SHD76954.1 putative serine/threonine-protein kinase Sps1 [[Clostridium] ultunense Esp]